MLPFNRLAARRNNHSNFEHNNQAAAHQVNQKAINLTTYETRVAEGRQLLMTQIKPPCNTE